MPIMKNIKLLVLLLTSLHITPMHKDQYAYKQAIDEIVIKHRELDEFFTCMQASGLTHESFRQFIENKLTARHYDQQTSPRVIISQAEELIYEKMQCRFIYALNSAINKDRIKKAEIRDGIDNDPITSVPKQDRLSKDKGNHILQSSVNEHMKKIVANAQAIADKVQDPMFLYFMQNNNQSIQNIVRQWLLNQWEFEWEFKYNRTDTLRQNHCNNASTPLYTAISNTNTEITSILVDAQVNFNIKDRHGNTPLHIATKKNPYDIATIPEEASMLIDDIAEVISMIIYVGADVDKQNNNGETPLHLASKIDTKIAQLFIHAGADVNIKNNNGDTPLHIAAKNNFHVAQKLISAGADVNSKNNNGDTPLHIAASEMHSRIPRLLMSAGAHVNVQNQNGNTPLHIAELSLRERSRIVHELICGAGAHIAELSFIMRSQIMDDLINAGADVNIQNNKDQTPCTELIQTRRPEPTPTVIEQEIPETPSCCNIS